MKVTMHRLRLAHRERARGQLLKQPPAKTADLGRADSVGHQRVCSRLAFEKTLAPHPARRVPGTHHTERRDSIARRQPRAEFWQDQTIPSASAVTAAETEAGRPPL